MKKIISCDNLEEDKILRAKAKEVDFKKESTEYLSKTVKEMEESLGSQKDGIGLAAPQIGISLRIFIVSKKIKEVGVSSDFTYINPKIIKKSKKKESKEEGCLSARKYFGEVERHNNVTIEYFDINGKRKKRDSGGILAHIFQHEIDHLDGILFVDKASKCREYSEEEIKEIEKENLV